MNPNKGIIWDKRNPFNISLERQKENLTVFDNSCGYDETLKKLAIKKQKKINIDKEIRENAGLYNFVPDVPEFSKKRLTETVDLLGFLDL